MENNFKRFLSLVVAFVMVFGMIPATVFATEAETTEAMVAQVGETQYATLAEAVTAANDIEGGATVTLLADVTLGTKLTISGDVTIEGNYTITRDDSYTGTFFTVNAGATLTLKDIVVDGGNNWTFHEEAYKAQVNSGNRVSNSEVCYTTYEEGAPVATATVVSVSGNVILDGATFQNHVGGTLFGVASGATLTMNDAVVNHNTKNGSSVVASVSGGATWYINGNTRITNNHNHGGNGTLSYMCGTTIMNGGEISSNTGVDNNGSVFMLYGSAAYFEMNGGTISDNWALYGTNNGWNCVFYVYGNGATFVMNDGVIESNVSNVIPGVTSNGSNATIDLNGGVIRNNVSTKNYVGTEVYSYCPVTIAEGVVITDAAAFYNNVENNGTIQGEIYLGKSAVVSGNGTVTGDVRAAGTNTITGGTYLGNLRVTGSLTITDGIFADLEAIKYLAPGLGLAKNADGTYTVTDQVAEVNGVVYNSVADAEAAAAEGDTIKMLAIAPIRESVLVDQTTVIDLNNNELYATVDDVYPMIRATADVTVTGNGGVDAVMFGSGYAFIVGSNDAEGNLTIESGKHYGATTVASVTKGTLNIEGGYYEATAYVDENGTDYGHRYTLNCIDANYNDGSAVISVTGGEFYGFDPDCNLAEGEATDFVPENYRSTEYAATVEGRLSTWVVTFDAVAYNVQDKVYFMDLSDALDVADKGETVQLLKTWYEELVLVPAGVTFDLNGNVVETKNTLSFGVIMDGKENVGGIKIPFKTTEAFTKLQPENGGYLPIYDDRDGVGMYKFFAYEVESSQYGSKNAGQVYFAARILFKNPAAYDVLINSDNTGMDFVMTMNWTGVTSFGVRYSITEGTLKTYAQYAYDALINGTENGKAISLTVNGVDKLGDGAFISAIPSVETVAEVTASSEIMNYDIP